MNRIILALATAFTASLWMLAQDEPKPTPSDKPLEKTVIEAERSRSETKDGATYLIFSGSVKLTATNLIITCNQLEVFANSNDEETEEAEAVIGEFSSIQKIIATGNVRIVQDQRTATAGRMEVLPNEEVILLDEDPMVFQDSYSVGGPGTQLTIHRGLGRVEMTGGPENKVSFSGPPIQDFGYEDDGKTIIPEEESAPEAQDKAPETSGEKPNQAEEKPAKPSTKDDK